MTMPLVDMTSRLFVFVCLSSLLLTNSSVLGNVGSLGSTHDLGSSATKGAAGNIVASSDTKRGAAMLRGQNIRNSAQSESDDGSAEEPPPTCSCDCCDVTRRRPGEISFAAEVKCTPNSKHSEDMCQSQCSPAKDDKVLQDEIIDSQRFCFFECKPAAGAHAPENTQCIALTDDEVTKVIDPAGNPIDPAFLYSPPMPPASFYNSIPPDSVYGYPGAAANLLSTHAAYSKTGQAPPNPDSVDPATAKKDADKGKAVANKEAGEAREEASKLRAIEEDKQNKLNEALQASGDGKLSLNPLASVADLDAAATKARAAASEANAFASEAISAYDSGRHAIWGLALSESAKEVLRWKKYAEDKAAKELSDRFKPTWQAKAAAKAQKASARYIESMLRAQESVKLYNTKGFDAAQQARSLWDEAQVIAMEANKLPRRTIKESNNAQEKILEAREKAKHAQELAKESKQYFATAGQVRKSIPTYAYDAQKAAAQAVQEFSQR